MKRINLEIKKHCSYCVKINLFSVYLQTKSKKYYLKCKACDRFSRKPYALKQLKEMGEISK